MVFGHILRGLHIAGVVGRFERGRRSRTIRWRMLVGLRLRADGRGAPRRAAGQRGRAASNVDRREREPRPFRIAVTRSFADPPMVAVLGRYARRMGVDPALVRRRNRCLPTPSMSSRATKCGAGRWRQVNSSLAARATRSIREAAGKHVVVAARPHVILDLEPRLAYPARSRGGVAQLVRAPACHAGGRGFKSRLSRHFHPVSALPHGARRAALSAAQVKSVSRPLCGRFRGAYDSASATR